MKKFISPGETGGAPIYFDDIVEIIQGEQWDVLNAILTGLYPTDSLVTAQYSGIIISGLIHSAPGAGSGDMTEGIVWLDGEFVRIPAYSGTYTSFIQRVADVNTSRVFKNGVAKDIIAETAITRFGSILDAGFDVAKQFIWCSPTANNRLLDVLFRREKWDNLSFSGGFLTGGASYNTPGCKIGTDKKVYLRGVVNIGSAVITTSNIFSNVSSAYRPTKEQVFLIPAFGGSGEVVRLRVKTNGDIAVEGLSGDSYFSLDGISYYL